MSEPQRHVVDRADWVTVAAAVLLCWSLTVLAARLYLRGPWGKHGPVGRDDLAIVLAQVSSHVLPL